MCQPCINESSGNRQGRWQLQPTGLNLIGHLVAGEEISPCQLVVAHVDRSGCSCDVTEHE